MTRRDLIQKVIVGGTTILVIPSVLESCTKEDPPAGNNNNNGGNKLTVDLTDPTYSALNTPGGFLSVSTLIVANTGTGFVALDRTCTHMGCSINYNNSAKNFPCPCHGSIYSLTGSVINGPATIALKSYPVTRAGDILTITL